jgi:hypothetical protein
MRTILFLCYTCLEQMRRLLEGKSDRVAHPLLGTLSLDLPRPVAGSKHRGLSILGILTETACRQEWVLERLLADSDY